MEKIKVWAHRGASGYAPENTLEAFQLALEMKADGVELDVQMTRDGHLVVAHDEWIDRVSNGSGYIKDYTLAELKQLDFGKALPEFGIARIPTLEEVYDLLKKSDLYINLEIKTGRIFYKGLEERLLALEKHMNMQERILYSSFNHYSLKRIKALEPRVRTGLLYSDGIFEVAVYGAGLGVEALHPAYSNLQYPEFAKQAIKYGLSVNVWTINTEEEVTECMRQGVNAVITNYPDQMKLWIEKMKGFNREE